MLAFALFAAVLSVPTTPSDSFAALLEKNPYIAPTETDVRQVG